MKQRGMEGNAANAAGGPLNQTKCKLSDWQRLIAGLRESILNRHPCCSVCANRLGGDTQLSVLLSASRVCEKCQRAVSSIPNRRKPVSPAKFKKTAKPRESIKAPEPLARKARTNRVRCALRDLEEGIELGLVQERRIRNCLFAMCRVCCVCKTRLAVKARLSRPMAQLVVDRLACPGCVDVAFDLVIKEEAIIESLIGGAA